MKELNDIVVSKTAEMINNGTVEKMITENLEKAIASSVQSALQSYGDFGKALTEKIETAIQCAARDIEIPDYNLFIKGVVERKYSEVLHESGVKHLEQIVAKAVKPVKGRAKISEMLNEIQEEWGDLAREQGKECIEIECNGDDDGKALYVCFKDPQYSDDVKVTFYNFNKKDEEEDLWHIGYIREGRTQVTGRVSNKARTCTNNVTDLLYKYYAMGTEFEMDTEVESIYVADY